MLPGFRRRILIEPMETCVRAMLEDDYHHMSVTLHHTDGLISDVRPEMIRWPWSTCRGAMEQCEQTFAGVAMAGLSNRRQRSANCTHLHDLVLFAAAHSADCKPIAYDIHVTDPVNDLRIATLRASSGIRLEWRLKGTIFEHPNEISGHTLMQLGDWIASLDPTRAEAARILRWATMLAHGRQMNIPAHCGTERFPLGSCYTFSAEVAPMARRLPGADLDLSVDGKAPLADHRSHFEIENWSM